MKLTFLGTGTSRGIPVIGCTCSVCQSNDPRNKRLRSSVLIERADTTVIIDASVDFRLQMLRHDVRRLDAVVFTHSHADHILGLDDVYPFSVRSGKPLPVWAAADTLNQIKITFRYLFSENPYPGIAEIDPRVIDGPFTVGDLTFQPIPLFHGRLPILGFRIGDLAYLTDVSMIPDESKRRLRGIRWLVVDGLRHRPHPAHFSVSEAIQAAVELGAGRTYLIHMSHDIDHEETSRTLPESVCLAYDGLALNLG